MRLRGQLIGVAILLILVAGVAALAGRLDAGIGQPLAEVALQSPQPGPPGSTAAPPPRGAARPERIDRARQPEAEEPAPEPAPKPAEAEAAEERVEAAEAVADPELAGRLAGLLDDPELAGAHIGIAVIDHTGAPVFLHNADDWLLPASTQKVVTAAGALAALGGDFRYHTRLRATAPLRGDGIIEGDLVLVGGADPTLASPMFTERLARSRPATRITALADQLAARGVRRITGAVVADPTVLPHQPIAEGWRSRYFEGGSARLASGLTIDAGLRLTQRGRHLRAEPSPDPAGEAAAALRSQLQRRGITVDGGVITAVEPVQTVTELAAVSSPPLRELLRYTLQRSDNHLADAIFRTIGLAGGDGTWQGGAAHTQAALAAVGLDWSGAALADGSGLSRADRLSPRLLVELDAALYGSQVGPQWRELMAVAGRSGTLRRRLVGTMAEQNLRGKTGTLRDVRALAGAVNGPKGRYHLAVLVNDVGGAGTAAARRLQDRVVLALVEDLQRCPQVAAADRQASAEPPAASLGCAA